MKFHVVSISTSSAAITLGAVSYHYSISPTSNQSHGSFKTLRLFVESASSGVRCSSLHLCGSEIAARKSSPLSRSEAQSPFTSSVGWAACVVDIIVNVSISRLIHKFHSITGTNKLVYRLCVGDRISRRIVLGSVVRGPRDSAHTGDRTRG